MITWGISANSHDAAITVFYDEKIIFASHSERFSRVKNDRNLHPDLIQYALTFGDPQEIIWYENPYLKTIRQLFAGQGWKWKDNNIVNYLKSYGITAPVKFTSHHLSHAAGGYYTSKFDNACIVVLDAIGEFETTTIWDAQNSKLKKKWSQSFPHSIGLWYSAMTQRLGLKPLEDEYILMGMAAYGNRNYNFTILDDFVDNIEKITFKKNLHRGCLDWRLDTPVSRYFDVAKGTQSTYEALFYSVLQRARKLSKSKNLVLMGGCALNCAANDIAHKLFDNVWIMPNPGDAGSSMGSVLAHLGKHVHWPGPFLGYDMGYSSTEEEIVEYLLQNQICGVARGKAEFGPRAFGNRSLLADPRGIDIKDRVNNIKQRQEFRPFAPMILEEYADEIFELISNDHRYMQYTVRCKHPNLYPAIIHKDGTSRVQTVGTNDDRHIRRLLEIWYEKTGCPLLLNTSLNIKGQPMVNTYQDAIAFEHHYGVKVFN
jgi:carbamoyltransferase